MNKEILEQLKGIAERNHVAVIQYKKSPLDNNPPLRLIEPYSVTQGKQDMLLRAYQLDAEEGWRFFMLHKIIDVRDHGTIFTPRRKVTLAQGIITHVFEPYEAWNQSVKEYRDLILSVLSDMRVTNWEKEAIDGFKLRNKISDPQIRSVHLSIFSTCLQHKLSDGLIEDEEESEIHTINECLTICGYGIDL